MEKQHNYDYNFPAVLPGKLLLLISYLQYFTTQLAYKVTILYLLLNSNMVFVLIYFGL